jgi:hypothetical protein
MTPLTDHRYFLSSYGLAFEASWPRRARSFGSRLLDHARYALFGGPAPDSPEAVVNREAYLAAIDHVHKQDIEAAARAFTDLGYDVSIRPMR